MVSDRTTSTNEPDASWLLPLTGAITSAAKAASRLSAARRFLAAGCDLAKAVLRPDAVMNFVCCDDKLALFDRRTPWSRGMNASLCMDGEPSRDVHVPMMTPRDFRLFFKVLRLSLLDQAEGTFIAGENRVKPRDNYGFLLNFLVRFRMNAWLGPVSRWHESGERPREPGLSFPRPRR